MLKVMAMDEEEELKKAGDCVKQMETFIEMFSICFSQFQFYRLF